MELQINYIHGNLKRSEYKIFESDVQKRKD